MNYSGYSSLVIIIFFLLATGISLWFSLSSFIEGEPGAGSRFLAGTASMAAICLVTGFYNYPGKDLLAIILVIATCLVLFMLIKNPVEIARDGSKNPARSVDENDVIFSRMKLRPGTSGWNEYYSVHKYEEEQDAISRGLPGLLAESGQNYNPLTFVSADANFDIIGHLHAAIRQPSTEKSTEITPATLTRFLKGWAAYLGVHSIGICDLRDYHLYTFRGRSEDKGKPVIRSHKYALAFTVEMDHRNMQSAPFSPAVFESSQKYLDSAGIALQLSAFLKKSGWDSRAHIDGDYEVICPLVARDAGLGEIGRMGLLMTPGLGPRVRIAVVTTNAPLLTDHPDPNPAITEFCRICRKCAECCPARCIPAGDMQETEGISRWKIDSDLCYRYWCTSGTDCGRCMSVCPFSHPDNLMHNIVRRLIRRSLTMARLALVADDFFYGKKPVPKEIPSWMKPD